MKQFAPEIHRALDRAIEQHGVYRAKIARVHAFYKAMKLCKNQEDRVAIAKQACAELEGLRVAVDIARELKRTASMFDMAKEATDARIRS